MVRIDDHAAASAEAVQHEHPALLLCGELNCGQNPLRDPDGAGPHLYPHRFSSFFSMLRLGTLSQEKKLLKCYASNWHAEARVRHTLVPT